MRQPWVCGDCRSLNDARSNRCYSCRILRSSGELTAATSGIAASAARQQRTLLAQAARSGARYRPSWPAAVFVVPLILIATAIDISRTRATSALVSGQGRFLSDPVGFDEFLHLSAASGVAYLAAILAWSVWIAIVVANVPALVARWPSHSPVGAFFAPFIPIVNFKRPASVVSEVVGLLSGNQVTAGLIVAFWWVAVLASYLVPSIVVYGRRYLGGGYGTPVQSMIEVSELRLVFLVPAAILAIMVVFVVERVQRAALKRRATTVLGADGSAVPLG